MINIVPNKRWAEKSLYPNVVVDEDAYHFVEEIYAEEWARFGFNMVETGLRFYKRQCAFNILIAFFSLRWRDAGHGIRELRNIPSLSNLQDTDKVTYLLALARVKRFSVLICNFLNARQLCHLHNGEFYSYRVDDYICGYISVFRLEDEDVLEILNTLFFALPEINKYSFLFLQRKNRTQLVSKFF